ncbi:MAG TPA: EAL domain-containing protein [Steroidobacteraceae bacterium]|nr:EAL domain-containing protein [Steroidobacteraceae bacterium]
MPQTVLLIHDDGAKAKVVTDALLNSIDGTFIVEWVELCSEALQRLCRDGKERIAAVLVNLFLSDSNGIETFDRIFQKSPDVPILVLSSLEHENAAKLAVKRGAQDYLLEDDLHSYLLPKALRNMLERASNAEALFREKERAQVTLNSIGDAVVCTDISGNVTFLNPIAEALTGWLADGAIGRPFVQVFRIIDVPNRRRALNPMAAVVQTNRTLNLPEGCILIRRDGLEAAIEDSTAPIHDRRGRVTGAVMVFHDVTQARAMTQKMSHLAQYDYLTDLPNRLLLNDRLTQAITVAHRLQQHLAVLFVDVDRFKHVNDSLGHLIGDKLLVSISQRLVAGVRNSDTISRQGGDEFVILLSSVSHAADAALSAQKILTLAGMPHRVEENDLHVTLSVGISIYPDDGKDAETLVKNADIAMLNAKDGGRNNYQFFKRAMNEHAMERQSIEGSLRHALERCEFELHYQPKLDLMTQTLTGAEALIRWRLTNGGIVYPRDFIPVAEQCGYIVPIGQWVLREACRQRRSWLDAHLAAIPIAINISAVELRSKNFLDHVRAILQETGLAPQYLEFELTETAFMQDPQSTVAVLRALRDMGIQLTLDDFGTGYSSLSYLKRFPINALKIDKSFVQGLCTDSDDSKLVSAVINLGRSFHLDVIAEGVETLEQLIALKAKNCAEGQGYYFQRPIAASEFAKLLGTDLSTTVVA